MNYLDGSLYVYDMDVIQIKLRLYLVYGTKCRR